LAFLRVDALPADPAAHLGGFTSRISASGVEWKSLLSRLDLLCGCHGHMPKASATFCVARVLWSELSHRGQLSAGAAHDRGCVPSADSGDRVGGARVGVLDRARRPPRPSSRCSTGVASAVPEPRDRLRDHRNCDDGDGDLAAAYGPRDAALVRATRPASSTNRGEGAARRLAQLRLPACANAPDDAISTRIAPERATGDDVHHVVHRGGRTYIQYWFYYPDSNSTCSARTRSGSSAAADQGAHALVTGKDGYPGSIDDWEGFEVRVNRNGSAQVRATTMRVAVCKSAATNVGPHTGWTRVSRGSHSGHVPTEFSAIRSARTRLGSASSPMPFASCRSKPCAGDRYRRSRRGHAAVAQDAWKDPATDHSEVTRGRAGPVDYVRGRPVERKRGLSMAERAQQQDKRREEAQAGEGGR